MHNIFYCCERYYVLLYTTHYIIFYTNAWLVESKKFSSASAFEAESFVEWKGKEGQVGVHGTPPPPRSFHSRQGCQGELRRSRARGQPGVPLEFEAGRGAKTRNPHSWPGPGFRLLPGIGIFCSGRLRGPGWGAGVRWWDRKSVV